MPEQTAKRSREVSIDESSAKDLELQLKHNNVSALERLSRHTVVVCDSSEFEHIKKYNPKDATTNPSLILKAALLPEYSSLIDEAISYAIEKEENFQSRIDVAMDKLSVNFGKKISENVPGYVSTEVDARLSFDTEGTLTKARRIIAMYKEMGVDKSKVLIKIASTYEGIKAGEILQKEGISCNLTLLFSLIQAAACAEAGITLISPFVGRIMDWHKAKTGLTYNGNEDPGVVSVKEIYRYYKKFGYSTIVMGASFRNIGEILSLAGCDRLTIAPSLLEELTKFTGQLGLGLGPIDRKCTGHQYNTLMA
jgi:transaldolase